MTTAWTQDVSSCGARASLGVIDTGVDLSHPNLKGARIEVKTTRSADRAASDTDHGTGVVSLLAGTDESVVGLARGARIFAADAFHRGATGSTADTFDLITSLDWLFSQGVQTVNLSLSGPDNPVLKQAIEQSINRGTTLIAASGLPDAGNALGYPGRYKGVIAVAAVDPRLRPSKLSARGEHIYISAPGVGLIVAGTRGKLQQVDGTSFATPFVTAAYALARAKGQTTDEVTALLSKSAKDLGAPGRDPIYGWGIVQYSSLPRCP